MTINELARLSEPGGSRGALPRSPSAARAPLYARAAAGGDRARCTRPRGKHPACRPPAAARTGKVQPPTRSHRIAVDGCQGRDHARTARTRHDRTPTAGVDPTPECTCRKEQHEKGGSRNKRRSARAAAHLPADHDDRRSPRGRRDPHGGGPPHPGLTLAKSRRSADRQSQVVAEDGARERWSGKQRRRWLRGRPRSQTTQRYPEVLQPERVDRPRALET